MLGRCIKWHHLFSGSCFMHHLGTAQSSQCVLDIKCWILNEITSNLFHAPTSDLYTLPPNPELSQFYIKAKYPHMNFTHMWSSISPATSKRVEPRALFFCLFSLISLFLILHSHRLTYWHLASAVVHVKMLGYMHNPNPSPPTFPLISIPFC